MWGAQQWAQRTSRAQSAKFLYGKDCIIRPNGFIIRPPPPQKKKIVVLAYPTYPKIPPTLEVFFAQVKELRNCHKKS